MNSENLTVKIGGLAVLAVIWFLIFYITVPAISSAGMGMVLILIGLAAAATIVTVDQSGIVVGLVIFIAGAVGIILLNIFTSPIFNARTFANTIQTDIVSWEEVVAEAEANQLQQIDKQTANILAQREAGALLEYVSQYSVDERHNTFVLANGQKRAIPLGHSGLLKAWLNRHEGVPGYLLVDLTSGETELIRLENNMLYSPSSVFGYSLKRHLRFNYPTAILSQFYFEIDDNGQPFWVTGIVNKASWASTKELSKVLVIDPATGKIDEYSPDQAPAWVDHVYPSDLVIDQLSWFKKYQGGWWNSFVSQNSVVELTTSFVSSGGYNYLPSANGLNLYTGLTSASSDESNLGFAFANVRTGEIKEVNLAVAEEFSAMSSAEGSIQEKGYVATYPMILKINGRPYYFMAMKDSAGLTKTFAFVDAANFDKVELGTNAKLAFEKVKADSIGEVDLPDEKQTMEPIEITVSELQTVTLDGNSYLLIATDSAKLYLVPLKSNLALGFTKPGDKITISDYSEITTE